jgi:hypothetical protein
MVDIVRLGGWRLFKWLMKVVNAGRVHDVSGTKIVSVSSLAGCCWSLQSTQSVKEQFCPGPASSSKVGG